MIGGFDGSGLIGGLAGLAFGIADWAIFVYLIAPELERRKREGAWPGRGRATSLPVLRLAFLISCFALFPIAGYFAGRLLLPGII